VSPQKVILVVDDSPQNIQAITALLRQEYRLKAATSGETALALAAVSDWKPDLILLDIMMPGMDGYECCRRLKSDPITADIPVIFLTAKTDANAEAEGFSYGAVDYVHKPFDPIIVRARVKTQLALREARLKAEMAVRVRDQLLAATSHDLRTPLTIIMGQLEYISLHLERGKAVDTAWWATQTTTIARAAARMLDTVEDITDAAQLQAGHELMLQHEDVDFGELVRTIAGTLADAGSKVGTAPIEVAVPQGLLVQGDRARLERVVENVVGNAVKYSTHGTPVQVEVRSQGSWVVLVVRDTGVGIPPSELPNLFTHFFRASTSIGIPGTGIGLAGSKQIVEQHGGHIQLSSALGAGTTVTVSLPRAASRPEPIDEGLNPTPAVDFNTQSGA